MGDFGFWVFLTVLIVLFHGEPDIADGLINYLMSNGGC